MWSFTHSQQSKASPTEWVPNSYKKGFLVFVVAMGVPKTRSPAVCGGTYISSAAIPMIRCASRADGVDHAHKRGRDTKDSSLVQRIR
eukprot:3386480-Rhodomonas_salina.1